MRRTKSIQRGTKGDGKGVWNSHCDTQHPFRAIRANGDSARRLTAEQHQDQGPAGYKIHRRHSYATELMLQGMVNRGREEERGGMGG